MAEQDRVHSRTILRRTGISRATLNNYIRLGLIPSPVVERPGPDAGRTTRIGFFPFSVLATIQRIAELKRDGARISEIVAKLGAPGPARHASPGDDSSYRGSVRTPRQTELFPALLENGPPPKAKAPRENVPIHGKRDVRFSTRDTGRGIRNKPVWFSVLAAVVEESDRLRQSLLPDRFFSMAKALLRRHFLPVVATFEGIPMDMQWDRMVVAFPDDLPEGAFRRGFGCAMWMKNKCENEKMSIDGSDGFEDISWRINMAVHLARECLHRVDTGEYRFALSSGSSACDTLCIARKITGGSLWATKDLLLQGLATDQDRAWDFGLRCPESPGASFRRPGFIDLRDLPGGQDVPSIHIPPLMVAEVFIPYRPEGPEVR